MSPELQGQVDEWGDDGVPLPVLYRMFPSLSYGEQEWAALVFACDCPSCAMFRLRRITPPQRLPAVLDVPRLAA